MRQLGLDELVERARDFVANASDDHRVGGGLAWRRRDRLSDDEAQPDPVRDREDARRERDGDPLAAQQPLAAIVRVSDEVEEIVRSDGRQRDDRRLVPDGGAYEAVAVPPEQVVAELARLDRLAQASGKLDDELVLLEEAIRVLLVSVHRAERDRDASQEGELPPRVLAEHPRGAVEVAPDRGHRKDHVPAEGVIGNEERAAAGNVFEPDDLDVQPPGDPLDSGVQAARDVRVVRDEGLLVLRSKAVDAHAGGETLCVPTCGTTALRAFRP